MPTYQVNHNIFSEFCAVFRCNFTHVHDRFRIICVHVEDWTFHHLRDICAIRRGTSDSRVGCETNLYTREKRLQHYHRIHQNSNIYHKFAGVNLRSYIYVLLYNSLHGNYILTSDTTIGEKRTFNEPDC